jgi:hypothetical protein
MLKSRIRLLIIVFLTAGCSSAETDGRRDVIKMATAIPDTFIELGDLTDSLIDTGFSAAYRLKPDKFYFQYENQDGTTGDYFTPNDTVEKLLINPLLYLGVSQVWKLNKNNFIRFEFAKSHGFKPEVLVLKKGETSFQFGKDSFLKISDTTSVAGDIVNQRWAKIYKVNDRVWVYLPGN